MSVCWQIVCEETKEQVWCGQGAMMYRSPGALDLLEAFLYRHRGRPLTVQTDLTWGDGYTDWAGQDCCWRISIDGEPLGVYSGNLLQAIMTALMEERPGGTFSPATFACSAGEISYEAIPREKPPRPSFEPKVWDAEPPCK